MGGKWEAYAMQLKHFAQILVRSALISIVAVGLIAATPVAASRAFGPISTCGTINASGSYGLTNPIGKPGNCIIIRASNVTLNLNKFGIVGNGKVGQGVTIVHGIKNVQVTNGPISAWAIGIKDSGVNTHLQSLKVFNNVLRGVALVGATGSLVQNTSFPGNGSISIFADATAGAIVTGNNIGGSGRYGIWVRSSAGFKVRNNSVRQSGIAGIFVGCTVHGILNTLTCKHSNAGTIAYNQVVLSTHLGIAVDHGNTHMHVRYNHVSLSGKADLFDSNSGCGTDTWSRDIFKTHNQPCAN
jgi:parallel beta-helix repeat protein